MEREYVRAADLTGYLGLSRSAVYRLIRDGSIPSVRMRGSIIVPMQELKRRLEARAHGITKTEPA